MKFLFAATAALAGTVIAAPSQLEARQSTATEIKGKTCEKKIALVFARASTEPGNMGMSMGPVVCKGLKDKFKGEVACQGVGSPYSAGLADNVMPAGTTGAAITEAISMLTQASKCNKGDSIIVAGGYSQGTAVMMNAVSKVDAAIRSRVAGVVLFGYTKNAQQKGGIPNYPKEKVKVFCSSGDGVCGGTLAVTIGHFSYMGDGSGPKSIQFLVDAINKQRASGPGGASAAGGEEAASAPEAAPAPKAKGKGKGKGLVMIEEQE